MDSKSIPDRLELMVEIEDASISRSQLQGKRWVDDALRKSLGKANAVIIPWENFRELDTPVFPDGTADFFQDMRDSAKPELLPEIAVIDEQYSEVALHAALVITPTLFVTSFIAPVVTKFVADWLARRLLERAKHSDVKFQMYIEDENGKTRLISYEGPVISFDSLVSSQLLQDSSLVPKSAINDGATQNNALEEKENCEESNE
jgi:hypothetical protein